MPYQFNPFTGTLDAIQDLSAYATLSSLGDYIKKDGTSVTTASIPFAKGLSIPATDIFSINDSILEIGIPPTAWGNGTLRAFVVEDSFFGTPRTAYFTTVGQSGNDSINLSIIGGSGLTLTTGTGVSGVGAGLIIGAASAVNGTAAAGGDTSISAGNSGSLGGNGGAISLTAGGALHSSGSGGRIILLGGSGTGAGDRGYIGVLSSGAPNRFLLNNDARSSLYIQNHLEVDGTSWLDGALNVAGVATLTSLGITADTNQIIFDSDAAITTTLQDSAASSSKTLTLPNVTGTLAHLANAAQTFAGTVAFSNAVTVSSTSGINISNSTPILTFTDSNIGEDAFSLSTGSSGFRILNITDTRTVLAASNAGVNTFGDASSGSRTVFNAATGQVHTFQIGSASAITIAPSRISFSNFSSLYEPYISGAVTNTMFFDAPSSFRWNINTAEEMRIEANRMTFNNGSSDSYIDWATDGRLDVGGTPFFAKSRAIIGESEMSPYTTRYALSVQSPNAYTYIEILNSGGADLGAFFGMNTVSGTNHVFELWNYQGAAVGSGNYPVVFYGGYGSVELARFDRTGGAVFNESSLDIDFRVEGDTLAYMAFFDASNTTENIALLTTAAPNWQSMDRGIFIGNAETVPAGNPADGGFLYVESGALKYRGSSGTITTLGPA